MVDMKLANVQTNIPYGFCEEKEKAKKKYNSFERAISQAIESLIEIIFFFDHHEWHSWNENICIRRHNV